ncbi:hypothetical protein J1614_008626 [Plenodomus biglobosus]|nr:hypothetical protein J1614_008626 [Plenodomus biglobosus]
MGGESVDFLVASLIGGSRMQQWWSVWIYSDRGSAPVETSTNARNAQDWREIAELRTTFSNLTSATADFAI